MTAEQNYVLFDFDGVIVDTFEMASALAKRLCAQNTPERYRSFFEGNIFASFGDQDPPGTHEHGPECGTTLDWWTEYEKSKAYDACVFPGIEDAVRELSGLYTLIVVSSGHGELIIKPSLRKHGLDRYFVDILDATVHTSKSKKMEMVFEKYATTAESCVFVTDTLGDILEANEHRIGSIACSWGYHSHDRLERGLPFRILDKPSELVETVNEYFNR